MPSRATPAVRVKAPTQPAEGQYPIPSEWTLKNLLNPLPLEIFRTPEYRREPHLLRGQGVRFEELVTWPALNAIVRRQRVPSPRIDVSRDGTTVPLASYTRAATTPLGPLVHLDVEALNQLLRDGATLIVNSIDQEHAPVRAVRHALERDLGVHVSVNSYSSWGTTHGFAVHWDDHDTIILQVSGHKKWDLYGPTRRAPLHDDIESNRQPAGPPAETLLLRPGDFLYVPRGSWHDVTAVGEPSLHLTFSLLESTGTDFLAWLVHEAKRDQAVRQDIPRFASQKVREEYADELRSVMLGQITSKRLAEFEKALDAQSFLDPTPSFPFLGSLDSQLASKAGTVHLLSDRCRLQPGNDEVLLLASGQEFMFSNAALPLLTALAAGEQPTIDQVTRTLGAAVAADAIERLLSGGLIAFTEAAR